MNLDIESLIDDECERKEWLHHLDRVWVLFFLHKNWPMDLQNIPILVWTNSAQTIQTSLLQLSDNATGIDGPLDERGNIIVNMISYKVIGIQDVRGPKGFIWDRTARTAKVAKKTCPRYFF